MLSNYQIQKILGKGTFSTVKLAIDKETGEKKAIKILEKNKIRNNRDIIRIKREIDMVEKINHLNVAQVFDIKEDEDKYYIIMEYCENGELFNLILEKHRLSEEEAAYYYFQIINGLEYIHINNIIHRDLKPENLLLTNNNILKIIDFGLSNYNTCDNLLSTPCGSPCYASPEMVSGEKYNGFTSDIWSTGIILYAMIYGYLPFENINNNNDILFKKIYECKVDYPRSSCVFALDLLKRILVPNPNERIKICDIKKHKFYLKGKSIFYQKHKNLNYYKNIEQTKEKTFENNTNKKEKKENIQEKKPNKNYYIAEILKSKNEKSESKKYLRKNNYEIDENKILDNDSKIIKNDKKPKYRSKEKKDYDNCNRNILKENNNSSKKTIKSFHKNPIEEIRKRLENEDEEYFSHINKKEHKRNTYCNNIDNNREIKENLYKKLNSDIPRKKNIALAPTININKANNVPSKHEKEIGQKNEKKFSKREKTDNHINSIITNIIPKLNSVSSKNANFKIKIISPRQIQTSESKNQKKNICLDKNPNLNSYSIEYENENGYISQHLSNLKKISPLNFRDKKNIIINLQNDNNINYFIVNTKGSDNLLIQNENTNINNNNYNKTENYSNKKMKKYLNKENCKCEKRNIIQMDKKHSISEKKNNINQNENYLKESDDIKDNSKKEIFEENRKSYRIKKTGFNEFQNYSNSKIRESKPISIINFKSNETFFINSPSCKNKKDLNYTFIKKNRINKKNMENINNSQNFSANSDIKKNDKNYSLNQSDENNNEKIKQEQSKRNEKLKRKEYNNYFNRNSNLRSGLNNHMVFSSNYKTKHSNNKSLEDKYFKNNNNDKIENYENHVIIHKRAGTNNRNIDNNFKNNCIKVIRDSKEQINDEKLYKKLSPQTEPETNTSSLKNNIIINYRKLKKGFRKEQAEKQIKEKDKENDYYVKEEINQNKYYKDKKENLRLTLNKIHNNKISDDYITKNSVSRKILNSNDINKDNYDIYEKSNNTERNEMINKNNIHKTYVYINRNSDENKIFSNKGLIEKKQDNSNENKFLNKNKKVNELNNNNNNDKNKNKLIINTNNIISSISKINNGNFPSITIDMNILNKNNMKYLKFYDSIKNKL